MTAPWIKWEKGFSHKPEVVRIAVALGVSRLHAAALLMERVFEWTDSQIDSATVDDDGNATLRLGPHPMQLFDAHTEVPGLAEAMSAAGWLQERSDSLVFPNFDRHNGQSAKARALASGRQQRKRIRDSVTDVTQMSRSQRDKNVTRAEQSREEKNCIKADMTPSEILNAIGVGEPVRSALLRSEGCSSALLCQEWERAGEGRPRSRRKVFIAEVKKALNASIPKAKSVSAEVAQLQAIARSKLAHTEART